MHALQGGGGSGSSGGGEGGEGAGDDKGSQAPAAAPPAAAVYLQLDDCGEGDDADEAAFRGAGEFDDADAEGAEEEGEEEDRLPSSTHRSNDLRLVPLASSDQASSSPSPASVAKEIFSAMCEAAALNPAAGEELGDEGDGDDDDGEWFYDEKEVAEGLAAAPLSSAAAERLARYDALLQMPRAEDLDELLDDEEEEESGGEEFAEGDEEEEEANDNDGRFDDPEPEAVARTTT